MMPEQTKDYQRGYVAGRKKTEADIQTEKEAHDRLNSIKALQRERVYLACLNMALQHCSNWSIGGEKIKDAAGYCKLAKVFAENSITNI
jgi:hypothetical protein